MTNAEFKAWRERMDWTQSQAAKALGISLTAAQNYERGKAFASAATIRSVKIPPPVYYACRWLEHCAKASQDPDAPETVSGTFKLV